MKSAALAEMISKQILINDYALTEEQAMWMLRRKQDKDLQVAREMGGIMKSIMELENVFHPVFQQEMTNVWYKGQWQEVPKAWWEARRANHLHRLR